MTIFEVLQPKIGLKIDDVIENTVIEQHRSAKATEQLPPKHSIEYLIVFEDGTRVTVK